VSRSKERLELYLHSPNTLSVLCSVTAQGLYINLFY